ncbi:MAG: hypothetical protein U1F67_01330 [Rubrivivax sp.]
MDSGNLAAHLITLANALRHWLEVPVAPVAAAAGARDALELARQALQALPAVRRAHSNLWPQVVEQVDGIAAALDGMAMGGREVAGPLRIAARHSGTLLDIVRTLASEGGDELHADLLYWSDATHRCVQGWQRDPPAARSCRSDARAARCARGRRQHLAAAMDFAFLLDPHRKLLSIGCRTADGTLDPSCYDLLASEARLAASLPLPG